ncbi:SLC13 family permease [bacterium]|nr:SLC13 family permease [bacterium]
MSTPQLITLAVLVLLILGLFREWTKPAILFGIAGAALLLTEVIDAKDLLSGFANEQIAVIILLLIVSAVIEKARLMEHWLNQLFSKANTQSKFIRRLVPFAAFISGFLNNTPIVAAFIPYVFSWGKKNGVPPSKVLIPLSYAAIIGGTLTLIGTSTNLIVNGLAQEYGYEGFNIFEFTWVGLPIVLLGTLYMVVFSNKLLPAYGDAIDSVNRNTKEYLVETQVKPNSVLIDKTVADADLRSLKGLFLVEIIRGNRKIGPVKPTQNIREGDHLIFAGDTQSLPELLNTNLGLELPKLRDIPKQELIELVEAVVSYNSQLAGRKVRDTDFRGRYDAAIVGIHRNGEHLTGKIGDMVLENGDLLVLMAGKDFRKRLNDKAFYLISRVKEIPNIDRKKGWLITISALLVILLSAFKVLSLFKLLLLYIAISVVLKWIKPNELQRSLDLNLAFIAALSLAIGLAMEKSGTAQLIANSLNSVLGGFGAVGILVGIYLLTNVLTEFVTNVAAATLALPIAISLATTAGLPVQPYILCVAYAASFSFLSPIGYQTNLMVYGPGSYKFGDYFKFGLPLTLICFVVTIAGLSLRFNLF